MKIFLTLLLLAISMNSNAKPCSGIDRALSDARKTELAPVVAAEQQLPQVEIIESFHYKQWYILYIENHVSDEPFLFYSGDPIHSKPIAVWAGAARVDEKNEIKKWVLTNAHSIPNRLAECFAWHVTQNRAQ